MASSRRPARLQGVGERLVGDRQSGEPADRLPLLLDRRGPVAPVGVARGRSGRGPSSRPASTASPRRIRRPPRAAPRARGGPTPARRGPRASSGRSRITSRRTSAASDGWPLRRRAFPRPLRASPLRGPDARGDGEEPDRLLGTAGGHQLAPEVGVDPEVIAVRRLGPPQERDRRVSPAEERERRRPAG